MQGIRFNDGVIAVIILVIVLLGAGYYTWQVYNRQGQNDIDSSPASKVFRIDPAQEGYTDIEGNPKDLSSLVGEFTVATTWASWCVSCNDQLITLSTLATDPAFSEIKFVAINRAEQRTIAKRYLRTVTSAPALELVMDPNDHFYSTVEGYSMPETVIYDRGGDVHQRFRTEVNKLQLEEALHELIQDDAIE